jgi:hypothetical protein
VKTAEKHSEGNVFSKTIYHVVLLPGIEESDKDPDSKTETLLSLHLFSLLSDEYLGLQIKLKKVMVNLRMAGRFHGEGLLCISIFY